MIWLIAMLSAPAAEGLLPVVGAEAELGAGAAVSLAARKPVTQGVAVGGGLRADIRRDPRVGTEMRRCGGGGPACPDAFDHTGVGPGGYRTPPHARAHRFVPFADVELAASGDLTRGLLLRGGLAWQSGSFHSGSEGFVPVDAPLSRLDPAPRYGGYLQPELGTAYRWGESRMLLDLSVGMRARPFAINGAGNTAALPVTGYAGLGVGWAFLPKEALPPGRSTRKQWVRWRDVGAFGGGLIGAAAGGAVTHWGVQEGAGELRVVAGLAALPAATSLGLQLGGERRAVGWQMLGSTMGAVTAAVPAGAILYRSFERDMSHGPTLAAGALLVGSVAGGMLASSIARKDRNRKKTPPPGHQIPA